MSRVIKELYQKELEDGTLAVDVDKIIEDMNKLRDDLDYIGDNLTVQAKTNREQSKFNEAVEKKIRELVEANKYSLSALLVRVINRKKGDK